MAQVSLFLTLRKRQPCQGGLWALLSPPVDRDFHFHPWKCLLGVEHRNLVMAKKSSKSRRVRRPVRGLLVRKTLLVGALASQDMVSALLGDTANDTIYAISLDATVALANHTVAEGPIHVGIAHSDYSAAEIEEWFEASGAWDRADKIASEHNRRFCRRLGVFPGAGTDEVLNEGRSFRTKVRFLIQEGQTIQVWAFNTSDATLTTGASIVVDGTLWVRNA